jgi:hypothetical protein
MLIYKTLKVSLTLPSTMDFLPFLPPVVKMALMVPYFLMLRSSSLMLPTSLVLVRSMPEITGTFSRLLKRLVRSS